MERPLASELAKRSQISIIVRGNGFVHNEVALQELTHGGKDPDWAH